MSYTCKVHSFEELTFARIFLHLLVILRRHTNATCLVKLSLPSKLLSTSRVLPRHLRILEAYVNDLFRHTEPHCCGPKAGGRAEEGFAPLGSGTAWLPCRCRGQVSLSLNTLILYNGRAHEIIIDVEWLRGSVAGTRRNLG